MTSKITLTVLLLTLKVFIVRSQPAVFFQGNSAITVLKDGVLFIDGNYETQQAIASDGTIIVTGDLVNNSATGVFDSETGSVILSGSFDQTIYNNPWQFNNLIIKKNSGNIFLRSDIGIDSSLQFISGNLYLDTFDVNLADKGFLFGESEVSRVYGTTGTVKVKKIINYPDEADNISGIGFYIHAPTENFGVTEIIRSHQSITNAGNGSIARSFYIKTTLAAKPEKIIVNYFNNDGIDDENSMIFYSRNFPAINYYPYAGQSDIVNNKVSTTLFSSIQEQSITLSEISSNNTCLISNPDYVESIFLLPSEAIEGDTIFLINLSLPHPDSIQSRWNIGDGNIFYEEDMFYVFSDTGYYNVSLFVNNNYCSDALTKQIHIKPNGVKNSNGVVISNILNSFTFYPNPVSKELNWIIDLQDQYKCSLHLIDLWGRTVFERSYKEKNIQDFTDLYYLSRGVYVLQLEVMGKIFTYRLVKI